MKEKNIVVLGAGVTGLSAAYRLSKDPAVKVYVIEKRNAVGGLCGSFKDGDFVLDYGPHKFYTLLDGIVDELKELMGEELMERDKAQSIYMHGRYYTYPLKMTEMLTRFPLSESFKILFSYGTQLLKNFISNKDAVTYEEFIKERFGNGLYQSIFAPMAEKIYGDPSKLDRKLAEVRISSPGLLSVVKQLLFRSKIDKSIQAPKFHYPQMGYGRIPEKMREIAERNGATFHLGAEVNRLEIHDGKVAAVQFTDGNGDRQRLVCDELIYTIPIAQIGKLIPDYSPRLESVCEKVKSRNVIIYYFLLKSGPILPSMWVFFPEQEFRFGRLSEMTKFSPSTAPAGHTALMVDFTCDPEDPVWKMSDQALGDLLLGQLEPLNLFQADQVVKRFSKRFQSFYPVYNVGFQNNLNEIRELEGRFKNLYFIGRTGDFNYNNADQCMDMGFQAADHILGRRKGEWNGLRTERFDRYKIVD
ncbi:MAG: FAD-dependent oxidoreductase [Bdellovibrionales bacterium]|nr:FAD-dependent oxidoreductase [Bdellovibrionales bacterium]